LSDYFHKNHVLFEIQLESQLYIQSVTLEDQGRYKCTAKINDFYTARSELATVKVKCKLARYIALENIMYA